MTVDCRGRPISPGVTVVVADGGGGLSERVVQTVGQLVRFETGEVAAPACVAVVDEVPVEVSRLELGEDDMAVVRFGGFLSADTLQGMADAFRAKFPSTRLVILDGGLEITALSAEQLAELGLYPAPAPGVEPVQLQEPEIQREIADDETFLDGG